jgi:hypothetical protein
MAVRAGRMGRFVAFDQDPENLKVVERDLAPYGVKTVVGSVRKLCQGEIDLGRFDFIYSAGLYDYLDQPTAQCLTAVLFQMLQPGGQLLVANFLPHGKDIGYMEAYLDWHLIYRTVAELEAVTAQLPAEAIADQHTFIDEHQTIAFLEISKQ